MAREIFSLGIDVGSTTAKVVMVDPDGGVVYSAYRRHNAETVATLRSILHEAMDQLGNRLSGCLVTGSAGMGIAEKYSLPFIQEVISSADVVRQRYPQVRTLIDIGGEDAKIIFFDSHYRPDIRMNGSCAGGTGAFIDEMAILLNVPVAELDQLASRHTTIHPMASRCGVFAKTDLQNLLSRQVPREDIAASVFHAVVLQMLATLARGHDPLPPILFCGGPLTFLPSLRSAFLDVLQMSPQEAVAVESAALFPALGAALVHSASRRTCSLQELIEALSVEPSHSQVHSNRHPALFSNPAQYKSWKDGQKQHKVERISIADCQDRDYFLGVDSGSTTTKVVLIDDQGKIAFDFYASNGGNSIQAVQTGLSKIKQAFAERGFVPRIARSVATGYGEDLIRAAFQLDEGMVETLAHYRAARAFDPLVTFILDIGGQDMKAIYVRDGQIQNIEINEACSSGCGSFIESFSNSMGYQVSEFAQMACLAQAPYNLGTRCTVFMNSRVKQALREGARINDISAGLAFSVIKNALYKVLKITNPDVLGDHIVVQGGTFRNPAVQKALEQLIGRRVICPDLAELMGAYGAALTARDGYLNGKLHHSSFAGLAQVDQLGAYERKEIRCRGCENRCAITRLTFPGGNHYVSGNRCERIYSNGGKAERKGASLPDLKYRVLFDRPTKPPSPAALMIGIPRVLNMFENYPFWNALLVECGFQVVLSAPSNNSLYQSGAMHIMSENLCFPGKLVSGHIMDLIKAGVDRIFYPMVFFEQSEFSNATNSFNCPVVSGYPDVVRCAIDPAGRYGIPLDMPAINFRDEELLDVSCTRYLSSLGVSRKVIKKALEKAKTAQRAYKRQIQELGARMIEQAKDNGHPIVLLMGRPYQIDPHINHHIPELLTDLGVDVITEDGLPLMDGQELGKLHALSQWEYINRYFHAAHWVGKQDQIELVQLNSFGCGPDPFILEEVRAILAEYGKILTVIRIDEIESPGSTRLRLRSMIESMKMNQAVPLRRCIPRKTTRVFQDEDRDRTLIVPDFSPFCSPPIIRPFQDLGFNIVQLPPTDHNAVDVGLKYTNNEICYPGIICMGDLIMALQSGKYDLSKTAVGFSQTGGQCRATNIPQMIKKALVAAGFAEVPVVTLSTSFQVLNDQPGAKFNIFAYAYKAALGMMFTDALSELYHSKVIREIEKGAAWQTVDKYLHDFMDGSIPLTKHGVLDSLQAAVADFNLIGEKTGQYPRSGIVGEIYVKYNAFSNNHVAQWLIDQGVEVVLPHFFEFFAGGLVALQHGVKTHVKRRDATWLLTFLGQKLIHDFTQQFEAVMLRYRHFHPHPDVRDVAQLAKDILSINHQYGEGWLLAGEIASFVQHGVENVLCLQPFGCIANHVIAKGVQKRLQATYPQLNLLFLDADAGVSEVNFFNRMHFFLEQARAPLKLTA